MHKRVVFLVLFHFNNTPCVTGERKFWSRIQLFPSFPSFSRRALGRFASLRCKAFAVCGMLEYKYWGRGGIGMSAARQIGEQGEATGGEFGSDL